MAQTVTGTRTSSLENPATVLVGVILALPLELERLLGVPSAWIGWLSFPLQTSNVRWLFTGHSASPKRSLTKPLQSHSLLCSLAALRNQTVATQSRRSPTLLSCITSDSTALFQSHSDKRILRVSSDARFLQRAFP